jgi:hypothetical protein
MIRKTLILLTAVVSLTIANTSQAELGPKPEGPSAITDASLSKEFSGYQFVDAPVAQGKYNGEDVWVIDYKFTALNVFGVRLPCHLIFYIHNDGHQIAGEVPPISYAQEAMQKEQEAQRKAEQAAKDCRSKLDAQLSTKRFEYDSWKVFGTVTNNSTVAVKGVNVTISGFDTDHKIVNDTLAYADGGAYIQPGKTARFDTYITDQHRAITSWEVNVNVVYANNIIAQQE